MPDVVKGHAFLAGRRWSVTFAALPGSTAPMRRRTGAPRQVSAILDLLGFEPEDESKKRTPTPSVLNPGRALE